MVNLTLRALAAHVENHYNTCLSVIRRDQNGENIANRLTGRQRYIDKRKDQVTVLCADRVKRIQKSPVKTVFEVDALIYKKSCSRVSIHTYYTCMYYVCVIRQQAAKV